MQPASLFWVEIGQRIVELYFLFFVLSWIYAQPRSRQYFVIAFSAIMGIISLLDKLTWTASEAALKLVSWLMPGTYCVIFLLLPAAFPVLNEPKPVPNRVTFK
ncbi:MAG: hypothetical protein ACYDCJ_02185 [Gammaproteobacteria bacterium]